MLSSKIMRSHKARPKHIRNICGVRPVTVTGDRLVGPIYGEIERFAHASKSENPEYECNCYN